MGPRIDLNADLGEEAGDDEGLLEVVTSAAVACGFHAGSPEVALHTSRRAAARGVAIGAHPSYDDRVGFGRRDMEVPRDRLVADLVHQITVLAGAAREAGSDLRFVKPHGALYNRAAVDAEVADAVVEAVRRAGPFPVLALAGSVLLRRSAAAGLEAYGEAFADRGYAPDGTLLPRGRPGAVLTDPDRAAEQAVSLALGRGVPGPGGTIEVTAASICVHGDSPGALRTARAVRRALEGAGVRVEPFSPGPAATGSARR